MNFTINLLDNISNNNENEFNFNKIPNKSEEMAIYDIEVKYFS